MDLLLLILPVLAVKLWVDYSNRKCAERDARLTELVQNLDIGEGVTLLEGLQASFGGEMFWCAAQDIVSVYANRPPLPALSIYVQVFETEGDALRYEFEVRCGGRDMSGPEERSALFGDLIRTAKERRACPAAEKG